MRKLLKLFNKASIKTIFFKMNHSNLTFENAFLEVLNISINDFQNQYNSELNKFWAVIFNKSNFWF